MPEFHVEDDLAALVWQLAKPKPFEILTFSAALRRILPAANGTAPVSVVYSGKYAGVLNDVLKKAPSPNPAEWAASVPELRNLKNPSSWKAICDALRINVAGDSARRKLRNWVKSNRPNWPPVPGLDGDA